jgi:hypothetical protein
VLYNFGDQPVAGTLAVDTLPSDWSIELDTTTLHLEPGERRPVNARFLALPSAPDPTDDSWIRLRGAFPLQPQPVVAFRCRLAPESSTQP